MRVALVSARTVHHGADVDRDSADPADPADAATSTGDAATERRARLVELLAAAGHDVCVYCGKWWEGDLPTFEHDGVTYRAVGATPDDLWAGLRLVGALREFGPDVVHVAGDRPTHTLGARLGTLLGAPVVTDHYDLPSEGSLVRWAARASDAVIVPSELVATAVRERGVAGEVVHEVPDPIDVARIRRVEPDPDAGDIVYSRALDADANLESLLLALAEFREYDWSATVVGDGPERERYERQASDLRIADRIDFVGDRPLERRLAIFKGAHVYAQTALRTPFATDLLRALACGCVGVVEYHAHSAAHELVERHPRGFLATSDEELVECLADATGVERMTVDDSFADYDESRFLDRHLDCYRSVGADG